MQRRIPLCTCHFPFPSPAEVLSGVHHLSLRCARRNKCIGVLSSFCFSSASFVRRGSVPFFPRRLHGGLVQRWYSDAPPASSAWRSSIEGETCISHSSTTKKEKEHTWTPMNSSQNSPPSRRGTILQWDPIDRRGVLRDDLTGESLIIANAQAFESVLPTHLRGGLHGVQVRYSPAHQPKETCRVLIRRRVDPITASSYKEKPPIDFIMLGARGNMGKKEEEVMTSSQCKQQEEDTTGMKNKEAAPFECTSEKETQREKEKGENTQDEGKILSSNIRKGKDGEKDDPSHAGDRSTLPFKCAQHICVDLSSFTPEMLAHCDGPLALEAYAQVALTKGVERGKLALSGREGKGSFALEGGEGFPSLTPSNHLNDSVDHLSSGGAAGDQQKNAKDTKMEKKECTSPVSMAISQPPILSSSLGSAAVSTSSSSADIFSFLQDKEVAIPPPKHLKDMRSSVLFDRSTNEWLRLRRALGSAEAADAYLAQRQRSRDQKNGEMLASGQAWRTVVKEACTGVVLAWSPLHRTGVIKEGTFTVEECRRIRDGEYIDEKEEEEKEENVKVRKENNEEGHPHEQSRAGARNTTHPNNSSSATSTKSSTTSPSSNIALIRSAHCFDTALPSSLSLRGRLVTFRMVKYASPSNHLFAEGIEVLMDDEVEDDGKEGEGNELGKRCSSVSRVSDADRVDNNGTRRKEKGSSTLSSSWGNRERLDASLPRLTFPLASDGRPSAYFTTDAVEIDRRSKSHSRVDGPSPHHDHSSEEEKRANGARREGIMKKPKEGGGSAVSPSGLLHSSDPSNAFSSFLSSTTTTSSSTSHAQSKTDVPRLYGVIIRWSGGQGIIESSNGKHYYVSSAAHFNQLVDLSSHKLRGAVVSFLPDIPPFSSSSSAFRSPRIAPPAASNSQRTSLAQHSHSEWMDAPMNATEIELLCVASDNLESTRPMMELRPVRHPFPHSTSNRHSAEFSTAAMAASSPSPTLFGSSTPEGIPKQALKEEMTESENERLRDNTQCREGKQDESGDDQGRRTKMKEEEEGREEDRQWKFGFLVQWSSAEGQGIIQGEDVEKTRYVLKDIKENIKGRMIVSSYDKKKATAKEKEEEENACSAENQNNSHRICRSGPQQNSAAGAGTAVSSSDTHNTLSSSHWEFSPCTPGTKSFTALVQRKLVIGRCVKFMTYGTTGLLACNVIILPDMMREFETASSRMEWKGNSTQEERAEDEEEGEIQKKSSGVEALQNEEAIVSPTCTSYWLQRMERAGYDVKEVSNMQNKALTPPLDDEDDKDGGSGGGGAFLDSEDLLKKDHWWTDPRKNKKFPNSNMTAGHLALIGPASMMNLAAKASDPKRLDKMVKKYQARLTEDQKALAWEKAKEMAPKYEACIRRAKEKKEEPTFHFF